MIRSFLLLSCIVWCTSLTGCGGGGGSPPQPTVARSDLQFGYFGTAGSEIPETAAHVTFVQTPDWGDWDDVTDRERIAEDTIAMIQDAQSRGVPGVMVSVGFLLFTNSYEFRGTYDLVTFRARLEALGLGPYVMALYVLDEPDGKIARDRLAPVLTSTRAAWPGVKLAVIYGDQGTPAVEQYDWVGMDAYGRGAAVLSQLPAIRSDQRWIVVPGGAEPWRQDPQPFYEFANATPQVAAVMPFAWFDNYAGTTYHGIRSNGMAHAYCVVGARIRGTTC